MKVLAPLLLLLLAGLALSLGRPAPLAPAALTQTAALAVRAQPAPTLADASPPLAPEAEAPSTAPEAEPELLELGPLARVSDTSSVLVLELTPREVRLLERIEKPLPFRELNTGRGAYAYRVLDAQDRVLFVGAFDAPELCPDAEHREEPHLLGHVVLAHETSALLRIPTLPEAVSVEIARSIPGVDVTPRTLGRVALK
ncbi:MAG: hypothetical protein R3F62_30005 [Planctomycetota bacterium]